jgi:hypothetical protein
MTKNQTLSKTVASIGEEIGYELGNQMVTSFQNAHPTEPSSFIIGKNIIDQILAQPGCVGMQFYNAINEVGERTLVYVGLNADGNPLLKVSTVNSHGVLVSSDGIVADRSSRGGSNGGGAVGIDADDWNVTVD